MAEPEPATICLPDGAPVTSPAAAVLGLGLMGRHHARILRESAQVRLVGAVDRAGDRFGCVNGDTPVHPSVESLLDSTALDFAVVALPTEEHADAAIALMRAGVHVLVEKPLVATRHEAHTVIEACADAGVHAAVGHVERHNPALIELRRQLRAGEIGTPLYISTERRGPAPLRARDVDIVRDLATHDLDIVSWLSAAPVSSLAAQMCARHESFVAIQGNLADGTVFTSVVDRVTSAKRRRVRVVGDGGALVADTVAPTLTFFDSPGTLCTDARTGPQAQAVRFGIERAEPLARQLDAWCNRLAGDLRAPVVTLDEGLAVVLRAEAVLESAASGAVVRPSA